jgi:hypothetical protein
MQACYVSLNKMYKARWIGGSRAARRARAYIAHGAAGSGYRERCEAARVACVRARLLLARRVADH